MREAKGSFPSYEEGRGGRVNEGRRMEKASCKRVSAECKREGKQKSNTMRRSFSFDIFYFILFLFIFCPFFPEEGLNSWDSSTT